MLAVSSAYLYHTFIIAVQKQVYNMSNKSKNKKMKNLEAAVKQCHITVPKQEYPSEVMLFDNIEPSLLSMWPKIKMRVPNIFAHTFDYGKHERKLSTLNIVFHIIKKSSDFMFVPASFNDHKGLVQYFEKNQIPYHTFGHPRKRKMKVVIKGLPKDVNLIELKQKLKSVCIPVIRVHRMFIKDIPNKERNNPVLVVVPNDDSGKKLLRVRKVLGYDIMMEPPHVKVQQCYRCQKWGHSQRYCHGLIKCVKCAGDHFYKKCPKNTNDEPPKCANCDGEHTSSYRLCPDCPESTVYKTKQALSLRFKRFKKD